MKKTLKKLTALLLSLVMVLGCIPSFVNEVSAADLNVSIAYDRPTNESALLLLNGTNENTFTTHTGVTSASLTVKKLVDYTGQAQINPVYPANADNFYLLISELTLDGNADYIGTITYGNFGNITQLKMPEFFSPNKTTSGYYNYLNQVRDLKPRWEKTADNKITIYDTFNFNESATYTYKILGKNTSGVSIKLNYGGITYEPVEIEKRRTVDNGNNYTLLTEDENFLYFNETNCMYYFTAKFTNIDDVANLIDILDDSSKSWLPTRDEKPVGSWASWYKDADGNVYIGLDCQIWKSQDNYIVLDNLGDESNSGDIHTMTLRIFDKNRSLTASCNTPNDLTLKFYKDAEIYNGTLSKNESYKIVLELTDKSKFQGLGSFTHLNTNVDDFIVDTGATEWDIYVSDITSTASSYKLTINLDSKVLSNVELYANGSLDSNKDGEQQTVTFNGPSGSGFTCASMTDWYVDDNFNTKAQSLTPGVSYYKKVKLSPKTGYSFGDTPVVTPHDFIVKSAVKSGEDVVVVVEKKAVDVISTVNLTSSGELIETTDTITFSVDQSDVDKYQIKSLGSWWTNDSQGLIPSTWFDQGTTYYRTMSLEAKTQNDCEFNDATVPEVYVDGQLAECFSQEVSDNKTVYSYRIAYKAVKAVTLDIKVLNNSNKDVTIGDSMQGNALKVGTLVLAYFTEAEEFTEDGTSIKGSYTGKTYAKDIEYVLTYGTNGLTDFDTETGDAEKIKLGENSSKCITKVEWDKANSKLYVTYKPQFKSFKFKMYIDGTEVTKIPDGTPTNKITFKLTGPSGDINLIPTFEPDDDPIDKTKDYTVTLTGTTTHTEVGETIEGFTYDENLSGNRTFKSGNSITPYYDLKFNLPVLGGNLVEVKDFANGNNVSDVTITRMEVVDNDQKSYSSDLSDYTITFKNGGYPVTGKINKNSDYEVEVVSTKPSSFESCEQSGLTLSNFDSVKDDADVTFKGFTDWYVLNPTIVAEGNKVTYKAFLSAKEVLNLQVIGEGTFGVGQTPSYTFKTPENASYEIVTNSTSWIEEGQTDPATTIEDGKVYTSTLIVKLKDGYTFSNSWGIVTYDAYIPKTVTFNNSEKTIEFTVMKSADMDLVLTHDAVQTKDDMKSIKTYAESKITENSGLVIPKVSFGPLGSLTIDLLGKYELNISYKATEDVEDVSTTLNKANVSSIKTAKVNGKTPEFIYGNGIYPAAIMEAMLNGEDYMAAYFNYLKNENYTLNKSPLGRTYQSQNLAVRDSKFEVNEIVDLGKDGYVNFTNITPGLERNSVVAEGNLDTNGEFNPSDLEVEMWDETLATPDWSIIEDPHYVFEAGKRYRITYKAVNTKYDMTNIKINGTPATYTKASDYPATTGVAYSYTNTSDFAMWITYEFIAQTPSSGSKKYKANDPDNNVDKITGTGKKGSKRIVFPEPNRKVQSVIVTDKKGNRYEVTNEGDGTYSFIQPGCDVDVEINYKLRLIELTIGSLNAYVDSELNMLDVVPQVRNDRTMLPIRFVAENLGAKVDWAENAPDTVWITRGDIKIEITLGSDIAKVNGKEYKLDAVAFAENDRTYLPVRFVSENLNAIVEWNETNPMDVKIYER